MADQWYVNPDAVGAGNGTSEADAYTTLSAAEAAKNADITGANSVEFLCSTTGDKADATAVDFDGWATDATHTVTAKSNPNRRHDGKYGNASGAYKLEVTDGTAIDVNGCNYLTIEGLQIKTIYSSSACINIDISSVSAANKIVISKNHSIKMGNQLNHVGIGNTLVVFPESLVKINGL